MDSNIVAIFLFLVNFPPDKIPKIEKGGKYRVGERENKIVGDRGDKWEKSRRLRGRKCREENEKREEKGKKRDGEMKREKGDGG